MKEHIDPIHSLKPCRIHTHFSPSAFFHIHTNCLYTILLSLYHIHTTQQHHQFYTLLYTFHAHDSLFLFTIDKKRQKAQ